MIEISHSKSPDLSHIKLTGEFQKLDVLKLIENNYDELNDGVIWDATECDLSNVSSQDMRLLVDACAANTEHHKAAFVGGDDATYGVLRMFETYADLYSVPADIRTFRDKDSASEWLEGEFLTGAPTPRSSQP